LTKLPEAFNYASLTRIVFGAGAVENVGIEGRGAGGTKALVVTDQGVLKAGLIQGVVDSLAKAGLGVVIYDKVTTNPTMGVADEGYRKYSNEGCDILVAVGGGSSIDTAKVIGILANNPGPLEQYEGADKFKNSIPPLIAIPTAAGTGAEVTFSALVTDPDRHYKVSIRSPKLCPGVAILDPGMLKTLPSRIAATTGMDTLTHAVEAYVSTSANPITDLLALEAIKLCGNWLKRFVASPDDVEAATAMQLACIYAGMAFANARLGNAHAMGHPLGGHFNLHHGLACAIVLPRVMDYNLAASPNKFAEVARAMGQQVDNLSLSEAAELASRAVYDLLKDLDLPTRLSEVGVTVDKIPEMANDAVSSGIHNTNPQATDLNDLIRLYERCM